LLATVYASQNASWFSPHDQNRGMKVGTKSLLIGVHQIVWHPLTVYRAWSRLYGRPNLREALCIILHDWGYWGSLEMDGPTGAKHPEAGAAIAAALFDGAHGDLVLLHSRRYALDRKRNPSKLCWADKLSIVYEPDWFYLLRARASGELREYRKQAVAWVPPERSDREWLIWVKRRFLKTALSEARAAARKERWRTWKSFDDRLVGLSDPIRNPRARPRRSRRREISARIG
jgi:hypothetical protein